MKTGERANDALRRGMGRVGATIGTWCDAYRARGPGPAVDGANRFLRLQAAFVPASGKPPGFGLTMWHGMFDAAYTRVGDYIVRDDSRAGAADGGVWFVASQEALSPVLCVRATRVVDIARPAGAALSGVNGYGGVTREAAEPLLTGWPVALVAAGGGGTASADLPSDVPAGSWQVLLPFLPGVVPRNGDVISDDLGRSAVIATAELTAAGWRLVARQAVG